MKLTAKLRTAIAALFSAAILIPAAAAAQESTEVVDVTVHNRPSYTTEYQQQQYQQQQQAQQAREVYNSSQSQEANSQNDALQQLIAIEKGYMRVVKVYNKKLTEEEALIIARLVLYYANQYKLDPRLLMSVIAVESRFKPTAVSPKGAKGLGQLMPGTASGLGVKNAFNVAENIYGTARYLRAQYDRFANDERVLDMMLAAYNAGPEAVAKYNGVPPYRETINYVASVKKLFRFFKYGY